MRFELRHPMPRPADVAWKTFFHDDAYEAELKKQNSEHTAEVLEEGPKGDKHYTKTRITSHRPLPSFMKRAIGADHLSYVLEQWRDEGRYELRWKVTPPTAQDKIKAEGTYKLIATPSGCERLVSGEIKVSIPLVGGKIEKAIGEELKSSYERSAVFAREWLAAHT